MASRVLAQPFLDAKIRTAVEQELAAKGYVQVAGTDADFLLDYAALTTREDLSTFKDYYRYLARAALKVSRVRIRMATARAR